MAFDIKRIWFQTNDVKKKKKKNSPFCHRPPYLPERSLSLSLERRRPQLLRSARGPQLRSEKCKPLICHSPPEQSKVKRPILPSVPQPVSGGGARATCIMSAPAVG